MQLPVPRGPLSAAVCDRMRGTTRRVDDAAAARLPAAVIHDDDVQLALWLLYELHYRGFQGVADALEWAPDLLELRGRIETVFEAELRALAGPPEAVDGESVGDRLLALIEADDGPAVAGYVQRDATEEQLVELVQLRSIYHLRESDPHSFAIPRLDAASKAAFVELQYDEYGAGRPERVHSLLFAQGMAELGLDPTYGAYVDRAPAAVLAENNMMSLFGLHRRLRGAAMGHLAAFEATSSLPCRRHAQGIRRLGLSEQLAAYYDEHVEADAVHEQVAIHDICGRLVEHAPELEDDVLFGAAAFLALGALVGGAVLDAWARGESCLLPPPEEAVA